MACHNGEIFQIGGCVPKVGAQGADLGPRDRRHHLHRYKQLQTDMCCSDSELWALTCGWTLERRRLRT